MAKGDCYRPCSLEYNPVCANHDDYLLTYPNECAMEAAACTLKKSIVKVYDGQCKQSNGTATEDVPVAAIADAPAILTADASAIPVADASALATADTTATATPVDSKFDGDCYRPCPWKYTPVCALHDDYLMTYPNQCAMEAAACTLEKEIVKVYDGECKR
uniref:Kazal-like domain-containing protein n=1 Tax=Stomoxys calcitrans TaxID=35570 RepID=A0A1I8PHS1_STOCA